jgi:hypothetical protein
MTHSQYQEIALALHAQDFGPTVTAVVPFVSATDRRLELAQNIAAIFASNDWLFNHFAFIRTSMTGERVSL